MLQRKRLASAVILALATTYVIAQETAPNKIFIMSPPPNSAATVGVEFRIPGWVNIGNQATP